MSSIADLHEALGRLCADTGNKVYANGHTYRAADMSPLRLVEPVGFVDMACAKRLEALAADARAQMEPGRWEQLQAEWREAEWDRAKDLALRHSGEKGE